MSTAALQPAIKPRVLIVEDEAIVARDIKEMLENLGYEVPAIADSFEEALRHVSALPVDLLLMDIHIKGSVDGIQCAQRLKDLFGLPVVYLSAFTDDSTVARARATTPLGYLTKPVTAGALKAAVSVALDRRTSQRQIEQREEFLHLALRSTGEALILTDTQDCISFINAAAAELTGLERTAALGQQLHDVLHTSTHDGNAHYLDLRPHVPENRINSTLTTCLLHRPDGSSCAVLICSAPLSSNSKPYLGNAIILRDISGLVQKTAPHGNDLGN